MEDQRAEPILFPLLNPNEAEAVLVEVYVSEGQYVHQGDMLCSLETTKSTADVTAPADGYVKGLNYSTGQSALAGERLCYLSPDPHWAPAEEDAVKTSTPLGLRITRPALELARQLKLDLSALPAGSLITEAVIREYAQAASEEIDEPAGSPQSPAGLDPSAIVIYGGGGHGKMVIDLLRARHGYRIVGIIDDGLEAGKLIMGVPVLGGGDQLLDLYSEGTRLAVNAVGGIGDIRVRIKVFERLDGAGFTCPVITHPSAYIDPSAILEAGAQVMAVAYVGSEAKIGFGCIINTGAIISHDCILDRFSIISPGALLAGNVQVGEGALIGMGATINLGVKIGRGARVGNGSTVKSDVPEKGVVRAGTIWPI